MSDAVQRTIQARTARLAQVLEALAAHGVKQQQVAFELNVPTQYLSDVKHGRRPISEQLPPGWVMRTVLAPPGSCTVRAQVTCQI